MCAAGLLPQILRDAALMIVAPGDLAGANDGGGGQGVGDKRWRVSCR